MKVDEPKGRAKGGIAAAKAMTEAQRKARAQKGALARWGEKPVRAIRKGSFKDHFGVDVDCYVIDDTQRTAVISQTGMAIALGLSARGSSFPSFINSQAMAQSIGGELRSKLEKPVLIQWGSGGGEQPPSIVNGHAADLLIEVCNAISNASRAGKLGKRYEKVIQQAAIINGASAKAGITGLVYALTGYRPEIEEVIQAFKAFVQEEAKKYEKEFPMELYVEWARLYGVRLQRSWKNMHLTIDHIYTPLAKSEGKLLQLLRDARAQSGDRNKKLFQFLNEVGARSLRMQLGRVLEMAQSSTDQAVYEAKIEERFGNGQRSFNFPV